MSRYPRVPLGELCSVVAGGTPARKNPEHFDGKIPWVKIGDMLQGRVTSTDERITELAIKNSAAKVLPVDTVIISIFATIGKTAVLGVEAATNQAIVGLIPGSRDRISPAYLRRYLDSAVRELESQAKGVAQVNINSTILKALEIPLPTLAEQNRILSVLNRADTLRVKRRETIALLDALTQSVFLDMFGDIVNNTHGWPSGKISDLVAKFESGKSFAANSDDAAEAVYRILKVSAVTSGKFLSTESKPVPLAYNPPVSHIVRNGDLIFSRANTESLIGATALASSPPENLLLPDKLWRFVWHEESSATPLYFRQLFRQVELRREIARRSSGTSGSMKNISQQKVLSIECGIPPIDLRHAYEERVKTIEILTSKCSSHLADLDALFASLQDRAFCGKLWETAAS